MTASKKRTEKGQEGSGKPAGNGEPSPAEVTSSSGWGQDLNWDDATKDFDDEEKQMLEKFLLAAKDRHTLSGPYPDKKGGQPRYMVLDKKSNRVITNTRNQTIAKVAVDNWEKLGGVLKLITEEERAEKASAAAAAPAKAFVGAKLEKDVPIQYVLTTQASFDQVLYNELGRMLYQRILKIRELFKDDEDVMAFDFAEKEGESQLALTVGNVKKIRAIYSAALDHLIRGKDSAIEITKLELALDKETARLILERENVATMQTSVQYYKDFSDLAFACMCPTDLREFSQRLLVKNLLDVQARSQVAHAQEAIKAEGEEQKP